MVIGAFPAAKLGSLLLRQISKPIANYIKEQAKSSPVFRTYICMPPAQIYNWCEVKTKMWILNLGKPVNIPVLNEAMAIELGANLLGEAIIFIIAAGVLVSEYNRSSRKEAAKEAAKTDEMTAVNSELQELFFQMEEQRVLMKELVRTVLELESQVSNSKSSRPTPAYKPEDPPSDSPPPMVSEPVDLLPDKNDETVSDTSPVVSINHINASILMRAVQIVEKDFLDTSDYRRQEGILNVALNYLYKDLYKLPASMY